jgi:transposase
MYHINANTEHTEIFKKERIVHPIPNVQKRMEVLWLKHNKLSHKEIAKLADVSINTVTKYIRFYNEGGLEKLKKVNFYKPQSKLIDFKGTIEEYFKEHPPASIKEAMDKIEEITGLKRGETQIRTFLIKHLGLRWRKVGSIPAKADLQKQESFKKEKLEPRLEEAKQGKRKVFFVDAAHFVLAPFLGFLWSFSRIFIKAPAGRKRFNVLGALDAITHKLYTITNDSYINAMSVCELLYEIAKHNVNIPITLVLDNARYQKCKIVSELAEELNIELLYLPAYSPNLNLIERLWKFVKKQCLYSKYYSDFLVFRKTISDCLNETHTKYKKQLDSLLTLNFQTFKESQFMAV